MTVMYLHRRNRLRITVLVLFGLLFQQIAMAAFVCAPLRMSANPAAMAEDCADMNMAPMQAPADVCAAVCSPDWTLGADHVTLRVPPLLLPPPVFAPLSLLPRTHVAVQADVPLRRSDPPPRLRYCSMQV